MRFQSATSNGFIIRVFPRMRAPHTAPPLAGRPRRMQTEKTKGGRPCLAYPPLEERERVTPELGYQHRDHGKRKCQRNV